MQLHIFHYLFVFDFVFSVFLFLTNILWILHMNTDFNIALWYECEGFNSSIERFLFFFVCVCACRHACLCAFSVLFEQ